MRVITLAPPDAGKPTPFVPTERLLARAETEGRPDVTVEVIRHRRDVFAAQTKPLLRCYRQRGMLLEVDADRPAAAAKADLRRQLRLEAS